MHRMLEHDVPLACQLCAVYRVLFSNSGAVTAARLCNIPTRSMENGTAAGRKHEANDMLCDSGRKRGFDYYVPVCEHVAQFHGNKLPWTAINKCIYYIYL